MNTSRCRRLLLACFLFVAVATAQEPAAKSVAPEVHFSEQHKATCIILPGDTFPSAKLLSDEGQLVDTQTLLGEKLTIVLFWNTKQAYAWQAYRQLSKDFVVPHATQGVKGIAIIRADAFDGVQAAVRSFGAGIANLRDADDQLWNQVAKSKMPRIYLLDQEGKVVWMDVEFSEGTQRDLHQALKHYLK